MSENLSCTELRNISLGFYKLARHTNGKFHTSMFSNNHVIFLSDAYQRYLDEQIALLLSAVNHTAKQIVKLALLKATATGMGFFAKVDGVYDINHLLFPHFLRAFQTLLNTKQYPWIKEVEFPIFSDLGDEFFKMIFIGPKVGTTKVTSSKRDVLKFDKKEQEEYYPCVINPGDVNAFPGNGWSLTGVEPAIAHSSSLRFDQVYLVNPNLLSPKHHIPVHIDVNNLYKTTINDPSISTTYTSKL